MSNAAKVLTPDDLLHETVVVERWGHLFAGRELSEARRNGLIAYYALRTGPHYTIAQVMTYLALKVEPVLLWDEDSRLAQLRALKEAADSD